MVKLPSGPIWLASYPKSGNTWMRLLLSNFASDAGKPDDINQISQPSEIVTYRDIFENICLVDSILLTDEECDVLRPAFHDARAAEPDAPQWFKVHDAYACLSDGTPLLGRQIGMALYLVRDPRDVVVSFAFHMSMEIDRVVTFLNDGIDLTENNPLHFRQRCRSWSDHVSSWLDQQNVAVHLVRYEDMLADTAGVFARVLDFLGIARDAEAVARAVRFSSFGELQRQECEHGFKERQPKQQVFFRCGEAGDWRRHLNDAQVQAIERAHGPMMKRLGYELTTEGGTP
jgi:aryl sulfotransferase